MIPRLATGLVLGKMLPPHLGHLYLIGCALRQVERLYVVVEHFEGEGIPSTLRAEWVRTLVPNAHVLHLDRAMPQEPSAHPRFWPLWRETLRALAPEPLEVVFASETYGHRLAAELGARFLPVDPARQVVPVSGTAVRTNPEACAAHLPEVVRAHYGLPPRPARPVVRRVALVGPESTGKTTLAKQLAKRLDATFVPEHASTCLEAGVCDTSSFRARDFEDFARGQRASEDTLAELVGGLLLCDSDALTTRLYAERLLGECPPWIAEEAESRRYDLTLLTTADVPWQDAVHRVDRNGREGFFETMHAELSRLRRPFVLLDSDPERRLARATDAILALD
ncbi:MAG: AAA family ATPase [Sandaracinus sp.]|nr:AAA family ATPase [Sandaracinus sp.]